MFLFHLLEKFGFGKNFMKWIKKILTNKESCIINGEKISKHFKLKKGTRQGDSISAYIFILVLEVVFVALKLNKKISSLRIFKYELLYTAYVDDTTFFLINQNSVYRNVK